MGLISAKAGRCESEIDVQRPCWNFGRANAGEVERRNNERQAVYNPHGAEVGGREVCARLMLGHVYRELRIPR